MNSTRTSDDGTALANIPVIGTIYGWLDDAGANRYHIAVITIGLLGLLTLPFWNSSLVYLFALGNIWAIFAMSWDIISGHTHYISFGHSFISGAAAYTTALLTYNVNPDMALYITFPVSVLVALIATLVYALPSLRLRGPYFSVLTFVSVLIAMKAVYALSKYTNGEMGISTVEVFTYNTQVMYYLTLIPALLIGGVLLYISRSNVGMILKAIGDNEQAVESAGLDTAKFKIWGFVFSAIPMGIGGTLLAHFYGNVEPIGFLITDRSIEMIAYAVVGGMGTIVGPGAIVYPLLFLRDSLLQSLLGPTMRWVAFWIIVLVLIVGVRRGVFVDLWEWLDRLGGEEQ